MAFYPCLGVELDLMNLQHSHAVQSKRQPINGLDVVVAQKRQEAM